MKKNAKSAGAPWRQMAKPTFVLMNARSAANAQLR